MHSDQAPYRALFESLRDYEGSATYAEVLLPWVAENTAEVAWLRDLRARRGNPIPAITQEELWRLYALSRVFEILMLGFQRGTADGSAWCGPAISLQDFAHFAEHLRLEASSLAQYSPFHHEILEVTPAPEQRQPAQIVQYHWPCLMLGSLLFMRGGVALRAGSAVLRAGLADRSTLYWAFRRKYRPYQDLSHGWGSNSSWRTSFRRDYHLGGRFLFNVDAHCDLSACLPDAADESGRNPGISVRERVELLVNRCFVTTEKDSSDLWPYEDRIAFEAGALLGD